MCASAPISGSLCDVYQMHKFHIFRCVCGSFPQSPFSEYCEFSGLMLPHVIKFRLLFFIISPPPLRTALTRALNNLFFIHFFPIHCMCINSMFFDSAPNLLYLYIFSNCCFRSQSFLSIYLFTCCFCSVCVVCAADSDFDFGCLHSLWRAWSALARSLCNGSLFFLSLSFYVSVIFSRGVRVCTVQVN